MSHQTIQQESTSSTPAKSHILIQAFEKLERGTLDCLFPDHTRKIFRGAHPGVNATMELHDWNVLDRMLADGDIGLGEDYVIGLWDTDNLPALLYLLLDNTDAFRTFLRERYFHQRLTHFLKAKTRANTLGGSRRNIHEHYDLGNDFYRLWLDDTMTYSCGLFNGDPTKSLEEAQRAKYGRIFERLEPAAGDHILEIGCGWGGFAEEAARRGLNVTAVTISEEQRALARERMKKGGFDTAEIRLQDYREVEEQYDHVVSIGMFEHVGEEFWPVFMEKVRACLKDDGKALIQSIAVRDDIFEEHRNSSDFVREHIFPGGLLPSERRFRQEAEKAGLAVAEVFHFGPDYAITLEKWLRRFDKAVNDVRRLGYSERFIRKWRFYLSGSRAVFKVGRDSVMQVLLTNQ